jgi:hypothetical protein
MNSKNELCSLEQIYNFLLMRPYFHNYSQFEKLKEFFYEIHEMESGFFEVKNSYRFLGTFNGREKLIDSSHSPDFLDKSRFLQWVMHQINE